MTRTRFTLEHADAAWIVESTFDDVFWAPETTAYGRVVVRTRRRAERVAAVLEQHGARTRLVLTPTTEAPMTAHLATTWGTARAAIADLRVDLVNAETADRGYLADTTRIAEIEAEIARWTSLRDACRAVIL